MPKPTCLARRKTHRKLATTTQFDSRITQSPASTRASEDRERMRGRRVGIRFSGAASRSLAFGDSAGGCECRETHLARARRAPSGRSSLSAGNSNRAGVSVALGSLRRLSRNSLRSTVRTLTAGYWLHWPSYVPETRGKIVLLLRCLVVDDLGASVRLLSMGFSFIQRSNLR